MLGLNFFGCDYDTHNSNNNMYNYAVGVLDSNNNTLSLEPINHIFAMNVVNTNDNENITDDNNNASLSNYDRKHNLTDVFGTKKKKRVMKQMESNIISTDNITGVDAIHNAITITKQSADNNNNNDGDNEGNDELHTQGSEGAAEQALILHREQMLPHFNISGKTLNEVYAESDLVPGNVEKGIKEYLSQLQTELQERSNSGDNNSTPRKLELNEIKQYLREKGWTEICLELVDMIYTISYDTNATNQDTQNNKPFFKRLRMIYFLSCMLKFCVCLLSSHKRSVSREELLTNLDNPPLQLLRYLTETFATHRKVKESHTFQTTKTHS